MRLFVFGLGYSASRIAAALAADGWHVDGTGRAGHAFDDEAAVRAGVAAASHILSSVPPAGADDPVLRRYGPAIAASEARWIGYLSSTGVYGDAGGAWVDEGAPIGAGRRSARAAADLAWQALGARARVFRLPGIYGPGRSPFERLRAGMAHRIDAGGQVFSRIHVDDIVAGVRASLDGPAGVYNLADDRPAPQSDVVAHAARLVGIAVPPLVPLAEAGLSPMARGFYDEHRRVANGRARRLLGWHPRFADYRAGLAAVLRAGAACP